VRGDPKIKMPLYEYECESCRSRFERIQKFSDPPVELCPSCGGRVKKLPSSPAIQFKGSGWYITDYAKKTSSDTGKGTEAAAKDSKEAGSTDSGTKESGTKDAGAKDSGTKGSASKDSAPSTTPQSSSKTPSKS
jgi:putative FmdB family regulatory protein